MLVMEPNITKPIYSVIEVFHTVVQSLFTLEFTSRAEEAAMRDSCVAYPIS